jgi:tRNA threonylcarbamoyladenosine biosynthesis protein TsaB
MPRFLLIETSTPIGSVCVTENDTVLAATFEAEQKSHSARIIHMIQEVLRDAELSLSDLDAIGYSQGPGSYTGLRIGLSTAKGLCFRLQKPLMALSGLYGLANEAMKSVKADFYVPMIDARRDEVFHAVYDGSGKLIRQPAPHILKPGSLEALFSRGKVAFMGNGSSKAVNFFPDQLSIFSEPINCKAEFLLHEALVNFDLQEFADVGHEVPLYVKAFHGVKPSSGS